MQWRPDVMYNQQEKKNQNNYGFIVFSSTGVASLRSKNSCAQPLTLIKTENFSVEN